MKEKETKVIENELDYIYVAYINVDISKIKLQKDEVENIELISLSKFKNMIKEGKVIKRKEVWEKLFELTENDWVLHLYFITFLFI